MLIDRFKHLKGRSALSKLGRDQRGATIIEFAFVVGPFMALMIAVVQVSLTFFAQQTLDTTAEKSVRTLLTGKDQQNGTTQAQFKSLVCSKLPLFLKCANVMIDVQTATSFAAVNTGTPTLTYDHNGNVTNTWVYQPGVPGQITIARIMYIWNVNKGPLGFDLSNLSSGQRLLVSTTVFKTEQYSS